MSGPELKKLVGVVPDFPEPPASEEDPSALFLRIGELEYEAARLRIRHQELVYEQEQVTREGARIMEQINRLRERANELLTRQPAAP